MSEDPLFDSIKRDAFKVPDGYFENVTDQLLSKASAGMQSPTQSAPPKLGATIRKLMLTVLSAAAVVALLFVYFGQSSDMTQPSFAGLDDEVILAYLDTYADDVDLDFIVDQMEPQLTPNDVFLDNFSEEAINESIIDELIDEYNFE